MAAHLRLGLRAFTSQPVLRPSHTLSRRSFTTTPRKLQDSIVPPRRPVGAFRGTLFGFLLGTALSGAGLYYYVIEEYKVSNELLTEDIYTLQASVQRIEGYVRSLEEETKASKK